MSFAPDEALQVHLEALRALLEAVHEAQRQVASDDVAERLEALGATLEKIDRDAHLLRDRLTTVQLYASELEMPLGAEKAAHVVRQLNAAVRNLSAHVEAMFPR